MAHPCCAIIVLLIAVAGCGSSESGFTGASQSSEGQPGELSWSEQIAAVLAGRTVEIVVENTTASETSVGDRQLAELAGLKALKKLSVFGPEISASGLDALTALPNLEHLVVRGAPIDDDGASIIATMKTLRFLNLPQAVISDKGLEQLTRLPNLELLRFGGPQITDQGMATLSNLKSLRFLHLIGVPITDTGLRPIAKLKHLESFYLDASRTTDEGRSWLVKTRPDLHVHFDQRHHDLDPAKDRHDH